VPTEWLKVMLDEIARKRDDAQRAREELANRAKAHEPLPPDAPASAAARRDPASAT
jgi:hypothetical protein